MNELARRRLYGILDLELCRAGTGGSGRGRIDSWRRRSHSASRAKSRVKRSSPSLAVKLHRLTSAAGVPLIINDHPEIARDVALEGLHVGQDDRRHRPPRAKSLDAIAGSGNRPIPWRRRLPRWRKAPTTLALARSLPRRPSPNISRSGLDDIRRVHELVQLPIFCIGGIKLDNLPAVHRGWRKSRRHRIWPAARRRCRRRHSRGERTACRKSKIRNPEIIMSVLVVGSIALDTVKTPVEEHADQLGGSASYAAVGASFFSPVKLVGVVGDDFPAIGIRILEITQDRSQRSAADCR